MLIILDWIAYRYWTENKEAVLLASPAVLTYHRISGLDPHASAYLF